jgi:hypothetical protein
MEKWDSRRHINNRREGSVTIAEKMAEECIKEIEYHHESPVKIVERIIAIIAARGAEETCDAICDEFRDAGMIERIHRAGRKNKWWEEEA